MSGSPTPMDAGDAAEKLIKDGVDREPIHTDDGLVGWKGPAARGRNQTVFVWNQTTVFHDYQGQGSGYSMSQDVFERIKDVDYVYHPPTQSRFSPEAITKYGIRESKVDSLDTNSWSTNLPSGSQWTFNPNKL